LLIVVTPDVGALKTFGFIAASGAAASKRHNWYSESTFTIKILFNKDTKIPFAVPVHSDS
jgi:hypothetical protein